MTINITNVIGFFTNKIFISKFSGKSTPDQYSAICKRKIASAVKQGLPADTPENICKAIKSNNGVANVLLLCGSIEGDNIEIPQKREISDISKYHDFLFEKRAIKVWKQSNIGDGHQIKMSPLGNIPKYNARVMNEEQVSKDFKILKTSKVTYNVDVNGVNSKTNVAENTGEEEDEGASYPADPRIFDCFNPLCRRVFNTIGGREQHENGHSPCIENKRQESLRGIVQKEFAKKFGVSSEPQLFRQRRKIVTFLETLKPAMLFGGDLKPEIKEGSSLPKAPARITLNDKQAKYLLDLFEAGLSGKKKARADYVKKDMRYATVNGQEDGALLFQYEEWLSEERIKREFSKIAAAKKKKKPETVASPVKTPGKSIVQMMDNVVDMFTPNSKKRKPDTDIRSPSKMQAMANASSEEEIEDALEDLDAVEDFQFRVGILDIISAEAFDKSHPIQV